MPQVAAPPPLPSYELQAAPVHPHDPWRWTLAITVLFTAIGAIRLGIPSAPVFDEIHYLPAARSILEGGEYLNREHPLFGKQLIAFGIALFGDNPIGWRVMPLLAGSLLLYSGMRAMWFASLDRYASISFGILAMTSFTLLVLSQTAILDIFMAALLAVGAWQFAAAIREPETGRWRLALSGAALGLAMAAKWNAVPLAVLPGLAFLVARVAAGRRRLVASRRGIPVPGVSLAEAAISLGLIPLAVYALTFVPGYFQPGSPLAAQGIFSLHREMVDLLASVKDAHHYQSTWHDWLINRRAIWFEYAVIDDAQRGILYLGNPLTMLLGLPALVWCAASGFVSGTLRVDWTRLAMLIGFAASLGLWLVAPKPTQFYYHYFVPSLFLLGALALSLGDMRRAGLGWFSNGVLVASSALFVYFFPILTAGALDDPMGFKRWTWLDSWI